MSNEKKIKVKDNILMSGFPHAVSTNLITKNAINPRNIFNELKKDCLSEENVESIKVLTKAGQNKSHTEKESNSICENYTNADSDKKIATNCTQAYISADEITNKIFINTETSAIKDNNQKITRNGNTENFQCIANPKSVENIQFIEKKELNANIQSINRNAPTNNTQKIDEKKNIYDNIQYLASTKLDSIKNIKQECHQKEEDNKVMAINNIRKRSIIYNNESIENYLYSANEAVDNLTNETDLRDRVRKMKEKLAVAKNKLKKIEGLQ